MEANLSRSRPLAGHLSFFLSLVMVFVLPACSKAQDVAAGRAYFQASCALCHDASPARTAFQGPPLFGVGGRTIGGAKGYGYSDALKAAHARGEVWGEANLDAFLADPEKAMPGTEMPVAVADATDRRNLIAYLMSLTGAAPQAVSRTAAADSGADWRKDAPGAIHRVTAGDLPRPFATASAGNSARYVAPGADFLPKVPDGFTVSLFATGLEGPRNIRTAPNGDLFVVESGKGRISVYRNQGGQLSTTRETFAEGLNQPFGIAFSAPGGTSFNGPRWVYVANVGSVVRIPIGGGKAETVVANLSTTGGHATRDIALSPDGQYIYVSVGSASNVAEDIGAAPSGFIAGHAPGESWGSEAGRAQVLRFRADGSERHVLATGIRNCVGLVIRPGTNDLYCTTNERDGLGDNLVPDYFTRVSDGQFFGWPWYYLGDHEDPRQKGVRPDLKGRVAVPDTLFASHSAPLGFTFYRTPAGVNGFPADYEGSAFIALHGSWNRSARTGSKVVRVRFNGDTPSGEYEDFMTGFIIDDQRVSGRPVGVAVGPDGALYVSDDAGDRIWRVAAK